MIILEQYVIVSVWGATWEITITFIPEMRKADINVSELISSIDPFWPAHIVRIADPHLCNAAGFIYDFIRAAGYNGLPSTLCARRVRAGTEEQFVCVVSGDTVKKPAQRLIAFSPVAQARLGSGFDTSWDIFCAELLAQVIHIASLGCIQAAIHGRHANIRVCLETKSKTRADMSKP